MYLALNQGWQLKIRMFADKIIVEMYHPYGFDHTFEVYTITEMLLTMQDLTTKNLVYTSDPNFLNRE